MGLIVRLIPELLAFSHPVGFDTVYYAAVMKSDVVWPHWSSFFTSSWLLYALIVPLYNICDVDPFLLLKVLAPVLFGLNVAGVYWFARKMLGWDKRLSLFAGGFFAFQLASLRISWDLLRNTLGLGFLLFTLPFVKKLESKRDLAGFIVLSLLTVFAHEYAAVTLLVIVLSLVLWRFLRDGNKKVCGKLLLAVLPALAVFLMGVFLRVFPVGHFGELNVVWTGDAVYARHFGLPFFVDYLSVRSSVDYYASYWDLALSVVVLFGLLYATYLFLVLKGSFRNNVLDVWTGLLLIGSLGCLFVPFFALEYWHRWMFMLVYPFTFYAVNGLERMFRGFDVGSFRLGLSRKFKVMVLLTVLLGCTYLATPVSMASVGVSAGSIPVICPYFSTTPTVPYGDVNGVIRAMQWLDGHLGAGSCAVLHHAFLSWGQLYLDKSHIIVHFENDVGLAVDAALEHGFSRLYFVWWNEPIGWYGVTVPDYFVRVYDFGRISVYEYVR